MKVIHNIGFTDVELEDYRRQVFMNLWEAMRLLLEGMQELELKLARPENRVRWTSHLTKAPVADQVILKEYLHFFEESPMLSEGQAFPQEYKLPMKELWQDPNIQSITTKTNEIILPDSLS